MFQAISQLKKQQDIKGGTGGERIFDIAVVSDIRLLVIVNSNQMVILVNSHSGSTVAKITLNSNPCT